MFLSKHKISGAFLLILFINIGVVHFTRAQSGSSSEGSSESGPEEWIISFCMPVGNNIGQMLRLFHDNFGLSQAFVDSADVLTQSFSSPVNSNAVYIQLDRSSTFHFLQTVRGGTHVEVHVRVLLADNALIVMDRRHSTLNTAAPSDRCDRIVQTPEKANYAFNVVDHTDSSGWADKDRYVPPISEAEIASVLSPSIDPQGVDIVDDGEIVSVSSDGQVENSLSDLVSAEAKTLAENHLASSLFNNNLRSFCEKPNELWAFLLFMLTDPNFIDVIVWHKTESATFVLKEPRVVSLLWGLCKRTPNMDYRTMARALRYYYKSRIMQKGSGGLFSYRYIINLERLTGFTALQVKNIQRGIATLQAHMQPIGFTALVRRNLAAINFNINRVIEITTRNPVPTPRTAMASTSNGAIANASRVNRVSRTELSAVRAQLRDLNERVAELERQLLGSESSGTKLAKHDELRRRRFA